MVKVEKIRLSVELDQNKMSTSMEVKAPTISGLLTQVKSILIQERTDYLEKEEMMSCGELLAMMKFMVISKMEIEKRVAMTGCLVELEMIRRKVVLVMTT